MEVEIKKERMDESMSFQDEELANHSLKVMTNFMNDNKLTDVTLIADKDHECYSAHKVILSAASEYFTAMFTCNLKESTTTKVVLKEIDGVILKQIIDFCYTGHIDVNFENVEALFTASNMLQFNFIANSCCSFFINQLDINNCFGILKLALRNSFNELRWKTQRFINEHFMEVIEHQDFLHFEVDYIIQLLKNEYLNITSEDVAFNAIQKWISFDSTRKKYIPILMPYIELHLISMDHLFDTVLPFCASFNECLNLIIEATRWHLQPHKRSKLQSNFPRTRGPTFNHILAVGGFKDTGDDIIGSEMYCPKSGKWYSLRYIYSRKMNYSTIIIDQKLYILGGRDWDEPDDAFECIYSPKNTPNDDFPPMLNQRFSFGVAFLNGNLYVVGGSNGIDYLNTAEKFDIKKENWIHIAVMNFERSSLGVAVLNDYIYAIGGRNKSGILKCVEMYDPKINKWLILDPMISARSDFGVAVFNGYIYVYAGGNFRHCDRGNTFDRYDPKTNSWLPLLTFKRFLNGVSLITIGENLIIVGGHNGHKALTTVEKYDIKKDKVVAMTNLKIPRSNPDIFHVEEQIPSLMNHCIFCNGK